MKFKSFEFLMVVVTSSAAGIAINLSDWFPNPWRFILRMLCYVCLLTAGLLIGRADYRTDVEQISEDWSDYWREYYYDYYDFE